MKMLLPLFAVLVLGVIAIAVLAVLKQKGSQGAVAGKLPYRRKNWLLTKAERSFFGVLQQVTGNDYLLFCKVRLADVVDVERNAGQAAFNRISAKHVDFLLCDPSQVSPVLAIELDDASHGAARRQERDAFVDSVLAAAGLPLLRVPAKQNYVPAELANLIAEKIASASAMTQSSQTNIPAS